MVTPQSPFAKHARTHGLPPEMNPAAQVSDERSADGAFKRQEDTFRDRVSADGSSGYPAAAGRYHLYVSLACPWAHRIVLVLQLKGLQAAIGMTVADPVRDERGWAFRERPGCSPDPVNGFRFLKEAYLATDPGYRGRVSVPVLWDKETCRIVSNSDDDLLRMFGHEFDAVASNPSLDLYPPEHRAEIDALNANLYEKVNDGVYRAGFAATQAAYEAAVYPLFDTLDKLEARLSKRRYLFGSRPLETDWRLFVTLVRFDVAYFGLFKCNLRRIADYPNLSGYLCDLYQVPGVAETVNFDHIKRGYYMAHPGINPTRLVPPGPATDLARPHGRERLSSRDIEGAD